jgi:hypothetical protein
MTTKETGQNRLRRIESIDLIFEALRNKGQFWEALVHAWGYVESDIDVALVDEFGLLSNFALVTTKKQTVVKVDPKTKTKRTYEVQPDPRIVHLLRLNFERKVGILKDRKRMLGDESGPITTFANLRNDLFHGNNYQSRHIQLSNEEKSSLLNSAALALNASTKVVNRREGG